MIFVSEENLEKVKKLITKYRRLTVNITADELQINSESPRQIAIQNLGIRKTCGLVPHLLTDNQKDARLDASQDFVEMENQRGSKGMVQIKQPLYSPHLTHPHFFLLSRFQLALKGKRFDDISDIQRNGTRLLNSIPNEDFLQSCQEMYSSGVLLREVTISRLTLR
ncbi:histone-lysine N-methyltransferase SETMAR [Trichonephila clavipes]|nr:histone-lysine N-methyltransferase SETMAR [Trichonephila clavipes]